MAKSNKTNPSTDQLFEQAIDLIINIQLADTHTVRRTHVLLGHEHSMAVDEEGRNGDRARLLFAMSEFFGEAYTDF